MNQHNITQETESVLAFKDFLPETFKDLPYTLDNMEVPMRILVEDDDSLAPFIYMLAFHFQSELMARLGITGRIIVDDQTLLGIRLVFLEVIRKDPAALRSLNAFIAQSGEAFFTKGIELYDAWKRDALFTSFLEYCRAFIESKYKLGDIVTNTALIKNVYTEHFDYEKSLLKNKDVTPLPQWPGTSTNDDISDSFKEEQNTFCDDGLDDLFDFNDEDKEDMFANRIEEPSKNMIAPTTTVIEAIKAESHETLSLNAIARSVNPVVASFIEKLRLICKQPITKKGPVEVTEAMFWGAIVSSPEMRTQVAAHLQSGGDLLVTAKVMALLREVNKSVDDRLYNSGDDDGQNWFNSNLVDIPMIKLEENVAAVIGYIFKHEDGNVIFDASRFASVVDYALNYPGLPEARAIFQDLDFDRLALSKVCAQIKHQLDDAIVGQEDAKSALIDAFRATRNGTAHALRGPVFLYGASGVGKTALVKAFSHALNTTCGENYEFQMFNMEQLSDEKDMLQLFGSGHIYACASMGKLTTPVEFLPNRVILFDEIEKAPDVVIQSLLSLLSARQCEDRSTRRLIDFSQCIFVFTSNVGHEDALSEKPSNHQSILSGSFSQEFISRITQGHMCCCRPLTPEQQLSFIKKMSSELPQHDNLTFDANLPQALMLMAGDLNPRALQGQTHKLLSLIHKEEEQHIIEANLSSHHTQVKFDIPESCQPLTKLVKRMGRLKWQVEDSVSSICKHDRIYISISLSEPTLQHASEDLNCPFLAINPPSQTTFEQIVGQQNTIALLTQQTDQLNSMLCGEKRHVSPEGTLLYGQPGSGKTLLAGAISNRFQGTFIKINSADLTTGDTEKNIRQLFSIARRYAPSIIFLDEVDAIAPKRQGLSVAANLMVTALLTAMDGFDKEGAPIWVIGATNNPENMDDAVLREGRFGQKLTIGFPEKPEVLSFIDDYLKEQCIDDIEETKLNQLGDLLSNNSMGLITSVVQSSAEQVDNFSHFYSSCIKNNLEKLSGKIKARLEVCKDTHHCTAYHEAGHAVAIGLLSDNGFADVVVADIHPRDSSLGVVQRSSQNNIQHSTKRKIKHEIQIALAGRAAELILANCEEDLSTGAQSDITAATRLAKKAITRLGFSNQQNLFDHREFNFSDHDVREEVKEWMQQAHQSVTSLLKNNWHLVTALANALKRENQLFTEDILLIVDTACFQPSPTNKSEVAVY